MSPHVAVAVYLRDSLGLPWADADAHAAEICKLAQPSPDEDMHAYRLAAARNDRLERELQELHKRLLEERAKHPEMRR